MNRVVDIILASVFICLLFPLMIFISLWIKLETPGPILFKQKRVGKYEKPFYIYKFRTMYLHEQTPAELGALKHNHPLVTPIGYVLRRFKLDEIPQFLNVLKGELSLFGPRPCLFMRIATMSPSERRRFAVLPGITGWAEINGNVELTWEEQLMLDLWYVDHKSLRLDMLILWKTIVTILFGSFKNHFEISRAEMYLQASNHDWKEK